MCHKDIHLTQKLCLGPVGMCHSSCPALLFSLSWNMEACPETTEGLAMVSPTRLNGALAELVLDFLPCLCLASCPQCQCPPTRYLQKV